MVDETLETQQDELEGLTDRERRFVIAYTGECFGNVYQSALAAGHTGKNGGPFQAGWRYLHESRYVKVQEAIKVRMRRLAMDGEEITARFGDIARANMDDFASVDEAGELRIDWKKAEHAKAIGRLKKLSVAEKYYPAKDGEAKEERVQERRVTFELVDRQAALDKLAQMAGLLKGEGANDAAAMLAALLAQGSKTEGGTPAA